MWWGLLVVVSLCSLFLGVMSFFFPRFGLRIGLRGTRLNILLSLLFIALGINGLIHQQNEPVAEQLNLIRTTMVQNTNNIYHYETAKFENGIAVLINESAAYWINNQHQIYTLNRAAQDLSPSLPRAPVSVKLEKLHEKLIEHKRFYRG